MFPGGSSILGRSDETRHRPESNSKLRVNAATAAALSEGRASQGDLLRLRPKLFPDLHKGADDGCLDRNAQIADGEKNLPLCQYRIEQDRFLAVLAYFDVADRTRLSGRGSSCILNIVFAPNVPGNRGGAIQMNDLIVGKDDLIYASIPERLR
jgi:hypothetical protein